MTPFKPINWGSHGGVTYDKNSNLQLGEEMRGKVKYYTAYDPTTGARAAWTEQDPSQGAYYGVHAETATQRWDDYEKKFVEDKKKVVIEANNFQGKSDDKKKSGDVEIYGTPFRDEVNLNGCRGVKVNTAGDSENDEINVNDTNKGERSRILDSSGKGAYKNPVDRASADNEIRTGENDTIDFCTEGDGTPENPGSYADIQGAGTTSERDVAGIGKDDDNETPPEQQPVSGQTSVDVAKDANKSDSNASGTATGAYSGTVEVPYTSSVQEYNPKTGQYDEVGKAPANQVVDFSDSTKNAQDTTLAQADKKDTQPKK